MPFNSLREFISRLDAMGELKRVTVEADPVLEITEIADRVGKAGGPALLFEKVKGSSFPLLINAFGSYRRMETALGCAHLDEIGDRIEKLLSMRPPEGLREKIRALLALKDIAAVMPRKVKKAPCHELVHEEGPLLDTLPILTCWPGDGGPYITLPIVVTRDPDTGVQNYGMYRMQKFDGRSTGMHWQYNKDGARHYEKYRAMNRRMEVAVALGGPPAVTYASTAPLPPDIDEMLFAGWLEGRPVELVKCLSLDLYVPAQSDFVIEGYVDPGDERVEGPFGDHTGFYSAADVYPVFHVTRICHRRDAVYPATIVGKPPM
ncbi:MAG TPA: UbiD family decarboxylase, partial [Spirochaetes bacterium]|nr:UbiD family decarboxylase [Spirochaetota bacterium]